MPAPLSTTGAPSDAGTWQELEDVFARLGQLARSSVAPEQFYRTLLEECLRGLSASGGAVWLRDRGGQFTPAVQVDWPLTVLAGDDRSRRAHEELLSTAATAGRILCVAPATSGADGDLPVRNPTSHTLLIAPVHASVDESDRTSPAPGPSWTVAIIEVLLRGDASPATCRGSEQFLTAACELAADFYAFDELRSLRRGDDYREQLLALGSFVHRQLDLAATAYAVANEGRRVMGCDRLSVLALRGRRCRLLSTSGVGRVERRSQAARRLEEIAELVRRTDESVSYNDGQTDAMPPIDAALERHAEESHARQIAAIPLHPPAEPGMEDGSNRDARSRRRRRTPQFVLVAEQFDARLGDLYRDRLVEVGHVCVTALENALVVDRLPLGWLWRGLGAAKRQLVDHLPRTLLLLAAVIAAVAALVLVPADFNIDAPATLQPAVRRDVFAPRSGLVDEVLVEHGAQVAQGQPLLRLRDPQLELELKRVRGEMETTQRQLDAVRAMRTNRAIRDTDAADAHRLSADERELEQKLANLRSELELLGREQSKLLVTSPISGSVLTWDIGHRLFARPVERGQVLLTVADLSAEWQLELTVPDDRVGHVLAARRTIRPDLPVRYRLHSDDRDLHTGRLTQVCETADVITEPGAAPEPTVLVRVSLDPVHMSEAARGDLRPGVSARAQIACGRRSLGYVWLHDLWDTAREWLWL